MLDLFLDLGIFPVYQDLSFKFHIKLPKNAVLNVFGMGGLNRVTSTPGLDTTTWATRAGANFGRVSWGGTGTLGISYLKPLTDKTYMKHVLVGTGISVNQRFYYQNRDLVTADTTRINIDNDYRISYSGYVNHKFNNFHTHRSGLILNGMYTDVIYLESDSSGTIGNRPLLTDTMRIGNGFSMLMQAYTRSQFYYKKWQFNVGLHAMVLLFNGAFSIEPRVGVRYNISPKHKLSFSYGLHSQMEPFFAYVNRHYDNATKTRIMKNKDLQFNKAHHFVLGYQGEIFKRLRVGVELYYQYQYDLVVGADVPIARVGGYDYKFESFDLNNGGTANNYGVEISLEKAFNKGYYIMFNTSLFESNYIANDKIVRPSTFNANYIFNLVGGKEFRLGKKKATFLSLNLAATYSGAQYYTPLDLTVARNTGRFALDYLNPNTGRQDPLLLIDFSLVFKLNGKKTNSQITLQVNNILNRTPISGQFYDRDKQEEGFFYGTGIIPILGWRISF